jgi:Undecaprenyl-phosphate glucose phosphotransferase
MQFSGVESGVNSTDHGVYVKKNVSEYLIPYVILEVLTVVFVAYFTSCIYSQLVLSGWSTGSPYGVSAIILAITLMLISLSLRQFSAFQTQSLHRVVFNAAGALTVSFSFFLSALYLEKVAVDYSRGVYLIQLLTVSLPVIGIRTLAHARLRRAIVQNRVEGRRAVVIGAAEAHHYPVVASELEAAGVTLLRSMPFPKIDQWDEDALRDFIEECRVLKPDDVLIVANTSHLSESAKLGKWLSRLPVSVHVIPADAEELLGSTKLSEFGTLVAFELRVPGLVKITNRIIKRCCDLVAATTGILLLAPALALVAIAIKLDSPGPVFFRQARHGFNNDTIRVLKFRTMTTTEDGHSFTQAKKNDPRVTRIGRWLRKKNIDELPQLVNVIMGEMSLIGPRPHPVAMNQNFERYISNLSRRHIVKPGITGWAQVNGYRGETDTLPKMQSRFDCDIYYIENWSLALDAKIMAMTLFSNKAYFYCVISADNAAASA